METAKDNRIGATNTMLGSAVTAGVISQEQADEVQAIEDIGERYEKASEVHSLEVKADASEILLQRALDADVLSTSDAQIIRETEDIAKRYELAQAAEKKSLSIRST